MIRSKNARQDDCRSPEERNKGFHAPGCLHALEWVLLPMWLFISQAEVIQHSKEWKRELTAHPVLLHPPYSPKIEPTTLMAIVISGIGIGLSALTCLGHCTPMMRSKGLWIYTVVARLCLLAVFIALVVLQTDFMPRPINTCWWDFTWPKNSNVPSSVPTIWEILPSHTKTEDGRYTSPHEVTKTSCELFLRRWRFELGIAVGYGVGICAAVAMLFYVKNPAKHDYPPGTKRHKFHRWMERHLFWVENRQSRPELWSRSQ